MADDMTLTVDTAALLAAIDRVPALVLAATRGAAHVTAQRIAREARARVARSGLAHVHTFEGVTVEESHDGQGFVVLETNPREKNLPLFLEHGTQYMTAQPFFDASARLEEGAHAQRVRDAIQDAMEEAGLGE